MSQILRAFSATVDDVDNSDRTIVSKISVGTVDRYNSLILPRGIDFKAYVKNPVVLFEHGKDVTRGAVPIGRNIWVKLNNQGNILIAKTRFAKDAFSDALYEFYRDGTMTGWSVRLLPKEQGSGPTRDESRSYAGMDKCDIVYRSTELTEYSCVAVPGQADALTEPELRSLSTLIVRGFWTPPDEVAPIIERMSESDGMASGGALVADDDEDEADEPDGDEDDDAVPPKKKKKKKKAKERSADDESDDSIAMSADDGEARSAEEVDAVADEPEATADEVEESDESVTRDGPPDEPRNRIGEWTDGADGGSKKSKVEPRKSRPDKYGEDGKPKAKVTSKDVEKSTRLQAKFDKSPLYKTPDVANDKTGEAYQFKVVKNAGRYDDKDEYKYYAKTVGSKEGDIDNEGHNNLQKAAKAADSAYKRYSKEFAKKSESRSAPEVETDDDFLGEFIDYLDETIDAPEPVAEDVAAPDPVERSAPESTPEPVDPLAGLPPLVGRSLEDIARGQAATIEAWRNSVKTMFSDVEAFSRGEA